MNLNCDLFFKVTFQFSHTNLRKFSFMHTYRLLNFLRGSRQKVFNISKGINGRHLFFYKHSFNDSSSSSIKLSNELYDLFDDTKGWIDSILLSLIIRENVWDKSFLTRFYWLISNFVRNKIERKKISKIQP